MNPSIFESLSLGMEFVNPPPLGELHIYSDHLERIIHLRPRIKC